MAVFKPDKKSREDYSTFAGIINRECKNFKLKELTLDMFKCLILYKDWWHQKMAKSEQNLKI